MAVEQWHTDVDEAQDWQELAEERGRALTAAQARLATAEKTCQAWMKTAQLAEEWADQLGKVRQWLQEQLLAQSQELSEAQQQKETALAEAAALREQCAAAKQALVQKYEALCQVEQPPRFHMLRWVRRQLLPPQTLRGRLVAQSVRVTLRLLRRSA